MNREILETVATQGAVIYERAIRDELPALVKSDDAAYGALRQALADLGKNLIDGKLVEGKGLNTVIHTTRVNGLSDAQLGAIADATLGAVKAASADGIVFKLDEANKDSFLTVIQETDDIMSGAGYETPSSQLLRDAVAAGPYGAQTQAEAGAEREMIPDHKLHAVARQALDFLEAVEVAQPRFDGEPADTIAALRDALKDANYLLPGESTARTTPYREQDGRGTREESEKILAISQHLVSVMTETGAIEDVIINGSAGGRMGLTIKLDVLKGFINEATPEKIPGEMAETKAVESDVLPKKAAQALLETLETGERIADSAQIDTQSPMHVMFPRKEISALKDNLADLDVTQADLIIGRVAEGEETVPGISARSAKAMADIVKELRAIASDSEPRGSFHAMPMEDMDRLSATSRQLIDTGAVNGLAALAGRGDVTASAHKDGKDAAAFATLREAMSGTRAPSPDRALGLIGKVLPEMSLAEYRALSPETRDRARVFVMTPGMGDFDKYEPASVFPHPQAVKWRHNRLRSAIREKLFNKDGKPNLEFRTRLMNLRHRPIVAPTKGEAEVIRQESERLYALHKKELVEARKDYLEGADRKAADFEAKDVKRFLAVLEASGSREMATIKLAKSDRELVVEHPDAPTLRGTLDQLGNLERARDGYKMGKVDADELRAAFETGRPTIRMHVEDDRVGRIEGHDPSKNQNRSREGFAIGA